MKDEKLAIIRVKEVHQEQGFMSQTYYDILEVSPNASQTVIAAAYRTLSQKYHPDKNNGDKNCEDMMAKINVAFGVLSDSIKRKLYDDELGLSKSIHNSKQEEQIKIEPEKVQRKVNSFEEYAPHVLGIIVIIGILFFVKTNSDNQFEPQLSQISIPINTEANNANNAWQNAEKLLTGNGQSQNYLKALEEYKTISDSKIFNDGRAEQRIAEMYFYGLGQNKDYLKAIDWYKKSKSEESEYMIGIMYLEGFGVKKDLVKAYYYFNKLQARDFILEPEYSFNPLIQEQQSKFIDTEGYTGRIFGKPIGYGYQRFSVSANVKKQLLDKRLTVNEINHAQNLKIED